jgi:predicted nucleotide-binding protein
LKKDQDFRGIKFASETIRNAYNEYMNYLDLKSTDREPEELRVSYDDTTWHFDHLSEFLVEYIKSDRYRVIHGGLTSSGQHSLFAIDGNEDRASVTIQLQTRESIESIFHQFVKDLDKSLTRPKPKPEIIFIGHGHDRQWKELRDHLRDYQKFEVATYEIEPRTSFLTQNVLQSMLNQSTIACLLFTGELRHDDGSLHARENVIHELGLFQGRLGFSKVMILLEDGVREFSNISGINEIRFPKGKIREAFGDIVATVKTMQQMA